MQTPSPQEPAAGPCALVIFGASGNLTKRLLLPALYNLQTFGLLPDKFAVIGVARRESDDAAFRQKLGEAVRELGTQKVDDAVGRSSNRAFSTARETTMNPTPTNT